MPQPRVYTGELPWQASTLALIACSMLAPCLAACPSPPTWPAGWRGLGSWTGQHQKLYSQRPEQKVSMFLFYMWVVCHAVHPPIQWVLWAWPWLYSRSLAWSAGRSLVAAPAGRWLSSCSTACYCTGFQCWRQWGCHHSPRRGRPCGIPAEGPEKCCGQAGNRNDLGYQSEPFQRRSTGKYLSCLTTLFLPFRSGVSTLVEVHLL